MEEEIIIKAFQKYLGALIEEMDEIDKAIYAPDYSMFKAGWLASRTNGVANNVINPTAPQ